MIEDELRAAFARHEARSPAAGPVRAAIDTAVVRRRRQHRAAQVAAAAVAVLLALVVTPVLARDRGTPPASLLGQPPATGPAGPLNFLVLGVDAAADGPARADTVLVAHLPKDRSRLYLISVPRDAGMEIPGHGTERINAGYILGGGGRAGLDLTRRAVAGATGLRFDGAAVLDYAAARGITDAVGGVTMCLPRTVTSQHTGRRYPAGCRHFDGRQAVDLLRQRYGLPGGAYDRDRHGQLFVRALAQRADELDVTGDPVRLARLATAAGRGLILDAGGRTLADLVRLPGPLGSDTVVAIGAPTFSAVSENGTYAYERLYPGVGEELFAAIRDDRLAQWAAAHPDHVRR